MTQVKMFDPFPRAQGTTLAGFSHHWTTVHAEIARRIPHIRHYVQSHRLADKPAELGAPRGETWCDGSSETWYDSATALQEMMDHPALIELMHDEGNFMDLSVRRLPVLTREHLIDAARVDPDRDGVKVLLFLRRRVGLSAEDFHSRWLEDADPAVGRAVGVTRQVRCTALPESYAFLHPNPDVRNADERPYDAVCELWWSDAATLADGAMREPGAWAQLLAPDGADVPGSFALFARERVIIH